MHKLSLDANSVNNNRMIFKVIVLRNRNLMLSKTTIKETKQKLLFNEIVLKSESAQYFLLH